MEKSLFVRACNGLQTPQTPIWLNRQAGRYMPDYHRVKGKTPSLDFFKNPEYQYRQYRTEHQSGNLCSIHFFFQISRVSDSNALVSINSNLFGILGEGKPSPHSTDLLVKR